MNQGKLGRPMLGAEQRFFDTGKDARRYLYSKGFYYEEHESPTSTVQIWANWASESGCEATLTPIPHGGWSVIIWL